MFLIRFVFYFTLSFAILCIPIGDGRHLFDKFYGLVTPYADKAVMTTKQKMSITKRYSKKLYSNSEPLEKDEVKTKAASLQKKPRDIKKRLPDDSYTDEERERLRKVLSND
ncbi:MAG: hypothetical protein Q7U04_11560 [Bacteriovorax sp.]|nr:hypothetical protein [Bacteriovorax sp.]